VLPRATPYSDALGDESCCWIEAEEAGLENLSKCFQWKHFEKHNPNVIAEMRAAAGLGPKRQD